MKLPRIFAGLTGLFSTTAPAPKAPEPIVRAEVDALLNQIESSPHERQKFIDLGTAMKGETNAKARHHVSERLAKILNATATFGADEDRYGVSDRTDNPDIVLNTAFYGQAAERHDIAAAFAATYLIITKSEKDPGTAIEIIKRAHEKNDNSAPSEFLMDRLLQLAVIRYHTGFVVNDREHCEFSQYRFN